MRYLFLTIVFIHGLIHLLGFLKAYNIAEIEALTNPISKPKGALWLLATLLFLATGFLYLFRVDLWWLVALAAVVLSQFLIIGTWADARFGTIANIIILLIVIMAGAEWNFGRNAHSKAKALLSLDSKSKNTEEANQAVNLHLLDNWLENVGATSVSGNIYLKQLAEMKLKPDDKWLQTEAEQWFTTRAPGFVWYAKVGQGAIMSFSGRDSFIEGKGQMLIKMYGLVPIVNAENEAIDDGTAIRFLAESVWFPWAAKSSYIDWEAFSENKLKATFTYEDLSVSGIFEFDDKGLPSKFEAMRFNDQTGKNEQWIVDIKSYQNFDGLILPSEVEVSWQLPEGKFTWYKLQVEDIELI